MANNDNFDLMHGTLEENPVCQNYIETDVKNLWKPAKMADFWNFLGIFVLNHPVSMGNVHLKKLFDLRFCDYLG